MAAAAAADRVRVELEAQPHGGALKRERLEEAEPTDIGVVDEVIRRLMSGEMLGMADAELAKANALALRQLVNARRDAGALVEIDLAERIMFEEARKARDAWLGFASRVGPLIAADLDIQVDRLVEVLTGHVHDQLAELGEPELDFAT